MLTFTYNLLDHGWARVVLLSADVTRTLHVSCISPALNDLVDATLGLLLGAEEARVS